MLDVRNLTMEDVSSALGLDRWITGNHGADNDPDWGRCPSCGATQEDAEQHALEDLYICPCGCRYDDDEAHFTPYEED
ncbi:MAG: hypothetical protein ABFE13_11990 [Phycisphaerales bacterium]